MKTQIQSRAVNVGLITPIYFNPFYSIIETACSVENINSVILILWIYHWDPLYFPHNSEKRIFSLKAVSTFVYKPTKAENLDKHQTGYLDGQKPPEVFHKMLMMWVCFILSSTKQSHKNNYMPNNKYTPPQISSLVITVYVSKYGNIQYSRMCFHCCILLVYHII